MELFIFGAGTLFLVCVPKVWDIITCACRYNIEINNLLPTAPVQGGSGWLSTATHYLIIL